MPSLRAPGGMRLQLETLRVSFPVRAAERPRLGGERESVLAAFKPSKPGPWAKFGVFNLGIQRMSGLDGGPETWIKAAQEQPGFIAPARARVPRTEWLRSKHSTSSETVGEDRRK
jgi:hypothetical protein